MPKLKHGLPKGKNVLLTGHSKKYDVYQDSKGKVYIYNGNSKKDFRNPKYWTILPNKKTKLKKVM